MDDATAWLLTFLAALAMVSLILLRALASRLPSRGAADVQHCDGPLDLADLRDRVRRLERIADGLER